MRMTCRTEAKVRYRGIHHVSALVRMDLDDLTKVKSDCPQFEESLKIDSADEDDVSDFHKSLFRLSRTEMRTTYATEGERKSKESQMSDRISDVFFDRGRPRCCPCRRRQHDVRDEKERTSFPEGDRESLGSRNLSNLSVLQPPSSRTSGEKKVGSAESVTNTSVDSPSSVAEKRKVGSVGSVTNMSV